MTLLTPARVEPLFVFTRCRDQRTEVLRCHNYHLALMASAISIYAILSCVRVCVAHANAGQAQALTN